MTNGAFGALTPLGAFGAYLTTNWGPKRWDPLEPIGLGGSPPEGRWAAPNDPQGIPADLKNASLTRELGGAFGAAGPRPGPGSRVRPKSGHARPPKEKYKDKQLI